MAHGRHVVVGVEVAIAVGVDQPHALTAHEMQRLAIEEVGHRRPERLGATLDQLRHCHATTRLATAEQTLRLVPADLSASSRSAATPRSLRPGWSDSGSS